jgi:hypothetical protein
VRVKKRGTPEIHPASLSTHAVDVFQFFSNIKIPHARRIPACLQENIPKPGYE